MALKKESFSREKYRRLLKENRKLKRQLREKEQKMRNLKSIMQEHFVLIDRLQSFIPDKGNWRDAFRKMYN